MEEGKQIIGKPMCSERDEPQLTVYRKMKTNKSHAGKLENTESGIPAEFQLAVTRRDCRNFHLRAGLNVAAWRKIIKLAELKKNRNQGFFIELSLLSKERKSHQIHKLILGGTDNMKHNTAPNKTCRRL